MLKKKIKSLYRDIEKSISNSVKKIAKEYLATLKSLKADIAVLYEKFSVKGKLTYSEMQKFNRFEKFFVQVKDRYKELTNKTASITLGNMKGAVKIGYYKSGWAYETETGTKLGFMTLPTKAVETMMTTPISGLKVSEIILKNKANGLINLRQQLTQGIVRGESINNISKRLTKLFGIDLYKAERIVRTEVLRTYELAHLASYEKASKKLDIDKQWLSAIDRRTRYSHVEMDGILAEKDGMFTLQAGDNSGAQAEAPKLFGIPSEDINCRCTFVEILNKKYEPEEISYSDWLKKHNIKLGKTQLAG